MTDHADLSRRLALAIGWGEGHVAVRGGAVVWCLEKHDGVGHGWRRFDYRDPQVIWPIAERYGCFPYSAGGGAWGASTRNGGYFGDTAAEAVTRAVIGARG